MGSLETEQLKEIAIRFSGYREFLNYEDLLCDSMGDDEFFEWAESNEVK